MSGLTPTLLIVSATFLLSHPVLAAEHDMGSDYGHFVQQAQMGVQRTIDCGRAAEADLQLGSDRSSWEPSPQIRALLGTQIPEFASDLTWVNSSPLTIAGLRGHPVFIRFWYRNCSMCESSAPLMNELYDDYAKEGLVVIGIHHAKTTKGDTVPEVAEAAQKLGNKFPIAIDNSWKTVDRLWLRGQARAYSSASFLIDPNGNIVWGHDLGRLEKNTPAAASLHAAIEELLKRQSASN